MYWDSTMGYHDREGFRCGVCYEFSMFNILTRKNLKLKEKPQIVMEGTYIINKSRLKIDEIHQRVLGLKRKVDKYDGDFVFLWHNRSFYNRDWGKYQILYEDILTN